MTIGIIATTEQKEASLLQETAGDAHILWMDHPQAVPELAAVIDLTDMKEHYPSAWYEMSDTLFFINRVEEVAKNWPSHFIRFNGWPGSWQRPLLEASCALPELRQKAELILHAIGKKPEWVPDIPGFISARVLAAIINEAYLSLEEGVSSKEDIDTAMKLGTNYPLGPFEWCEKIGCNRIYNLLKEMAVHDPAYQPARLLNQEAQP